MSNEWVPFGDTGPSKPQSALCPRKDLEVKLYIPLWSNYHLNHRIYGLQLSDRLDQQSDRSPYLCSFLGVLYNCRRNYVSNKVMNSARPMHLHENDRLSLLDVGTFTAFDISHEEGQGYSFTFYINRSKVEEEIDADFWFWLSVQDEAKEFYGH